MSDNNSSVELKLFRAVKNKDLCKVTSLLERNKDLNINFKNSNDSNRSILHIACIYGDTSILKKILEFNPNLNIQSDGGETPIMDTFSFGNFDCAKLLLSHRPRPNLTLKDDCGATVFHHAVSSMRPIQNLELLLHHDLDFFHDIIDSPGFIDNETLLHIVCYHERNLHPNINAIKFILSFSPNLNIRDGHGYTALSTASFLGSDPRVIKLLLSHNANPYLTDDKGKTPLDRAKEIKDKKFIHLLESHRYVVGSLKNLCIRFIKNKKNNHIKIPENFPPLLLKLNSDKDDRLKTLKIFSLSDSLSINSNSKRKRKRNSSLITTTNKKQKNLK